MKILLVDDHIETTERIALLIRRRITGEVVVAHKGDEAIRKALEFKPDVVVLDIELPVLNGFEVLEELKKREIDTRVIMLSGAYTEAEHIVRCIRAGACDFIKKPADVDKIVQSIERHFVLENADNLRLYAEAPSLIKQLIDLTDYEERRTRSIEVDKLMNRAIKTETELSELRIAKAEAEAIIKLRDSKIASLEAVQSTKVELAQGKWKTWWNKISPNERAAYIGLIGICMAGTFTFCVAVYNQSFTGNKSAPAVVSSANPMPIVSLSSSPTTPSPSPVPSASLVQVQSLNLNLEEYHDKLDSFGDRLGLRSDYVRSHRGDAVTWQGVVQNAILRSLNHAYVALQSEIKPEKYGYASFYFQNPNQAAIDCIRLLQVGDHVKISGLLNGDDEMGVNATDIVLLETAKRQTP